MRTIIVLSVLVVLSGALLIAGTASAKGPFRMGVELSGGDLPSSVVLGGLFSSEIVFQKDDVAVAPPEVFEPAYTVKLTPKQPDGEAGQDPVVLTMTYFPGNGDTPALLRGDWGGGDRYFEAGTAFRAALDGAIRAAFVEEGDGVGVVWYIVPGLASVGLVLIGGLAGRRLLFRR